MKKIIPLFILVFPQLLNAQRERIKENHAEKLWTVNLGGSGLQLGYEFLAGRNQTFVLIGGVGPVWYSARYYGVPDDDVVPGVIIAGEYRAYYNFTKRKDQQKNISNNAADYFGAQLTFLGRPIGNYPELYGVGDAYVIGPVWGMNRNMGKRIYFHVSVGPGVLYETKMLLSAFTLTGDIRFCLRLSS